MIYLSLCKKPPLISGRFSSQSQRLETAIIFRTVFSAVLRTILGVILRIVFGVVLRIILAVLAIFHIFVIVLHGLYLLKKALDFSYRTSMSLFFFFILFYLHFHIISIIIEW